LFGGKNVRNVRDMVCRFMTHQLIILAPPSTSPAKIE
jgi:hypothetical protein